jgi:hypothetical protein
MAFDQRTASKDRAATALRETAKRQDIGGARGAPSCVAPYARWPVTRGPENRPVGFMR